MKIAREKAILCYDILEKFEPSVKCSIGFMDKLNGLMSELRSLSEILEDLSDHKLTHFVSFTNNFANFAKETTVYEQTVTEFGRFLRNNSSELFVEYIKVENKG